MLELQVKELDGSESHIDNFEGYFTYLPLDGRSFGTYLQLGDGANSKGNTIDFSIGLAKFIKVGYMKRDGVGSWPSFRKSANGKTDGHGIAGIEGMEYLLFRSR